MVWKMETSNGNESAKIRWRAIPYLRGSGLDIGCGPWKISPHAVGIDGQAFPGVPAGRGPNLQMNCTSLPVFADDAFDFVYSSHLLEHIVDTEAVLREWLRVLSPGGYLVLYLPHKEFYPNIGEAGGNPDHKHDFLPGDVIEVVRRISADVGVALIENEERSGGDEYSFFQVYKKLDAPGFVDRTQPRPAKAAAIVRPGVYGDSLWASSTAYHLKREGYHVTVYTEEPGEEILRHDPNIDRLVVTDRNTLPVQHYGEFWAEEERRYDRWVNLVEICETRLLVTPQQLISSWPKDLRHEHCNRNYLEAMHEVAGVPHELQVRFHPSEDERAWARAERAALGARPVVVFGPSGSTAPKFWPYAQELVARLAALKVHVVIVGDTRGMQFAPQPYVHVKGMGEWTLRKSLSFAQVADAVIGQESVLTNSVCMEPMRKVVLLSHSTRENLTRDWVNTQSLAGAVPCYPCHRIHYTLETCTPGAGRAACQDAITPEHVLEALQDAINVGSAQLAAAAD
jgi:ADP-heptose:LPS heptosyltransferase/predicted SAM-dependent methyltransferase